MNKISFDSKIVYEKEISDIAYETLKQTYKNITGSNLGIKQLCNLDLISSKNKKLYPTNAFILLSDDDLRLKLFPHAKIECASFRGEDRFDFIAQKPMYGPLSTQSEQAYQFVLQNIGAQKPNEYPIQAIKELIINAVIHRDYSIPKQDIRVCIFSNRIEISNPGKLPSKINYSNLSKKQCIIRNQTISKTFKELSIAQQKGKGLQLIFKDLKNHPNIKFRYAVNNSRFELIFLKK